jgi:proteic killer suppression protein
MLDAAIQLEDLKIPPGNRLHALQEERTGQYAIRINDQFRGFVWKNGHAYDVAITDYH